MAEVTAAGQTFEALADSGPLRFHSLDFKLPASLSHRIRVAQNAKPLREDLVMNEERTQLAGTVVKGRPVLFSMCGSFKTNGALSLIHSVEGLSSLQWRGGSELSAFRYLRGSISASTQDKRCDELLAGFLLKETRPVEEAEG